MRPLKTLLPLNRYWKIQGTFYSPQGNYDVTKMDGKYIWFFARSRCYFLVDNTRTYKQSFYMTINGVRVDYDAEPMSSVMVDVTDFAKSAVLSDAGDGLGGALTIYSNIFPSANTPYTFRVLNGVYWTRATRERLPSVIPFYFEMGLGIPFYITADSCEILSRNTKFGEIGKFVGGDMTLLDYTIEGKYSNEFVHQTDTIERFRFHFLWLADEDTRCMHYVQLDWLGQFGGKKSWQFEVTEQNIKGSSQTAISNIERYDIRKSCTKQYTLVHKNADYITQKYLRDICFTESAEMLDVNDFEDMFGYSVRVLTNDFKVTEQEQDIKIQIEVEGYDSL